MYYVSSDAKENSNLKLSDKHRFGILFLKLYFSQSQFRHRSQEIRAHDASVTQPPLFVPFRWLPRWLPIRHRIKFKTAVLVYKCLHGMAPPYLASYCTPVTSQTGRSNLRSATTGQLIVLRTRTAYGSRSFAVHGPVEQFASWTAIAWHFSGRVQKAVEDFSV